MTPLRQRYIDDLRLKNFSPSTIRVYVHAVERYARYYGSSPVELGYEEVRGYLVNLASRGLSRGSLVIARNAIRHLYRDTLGQSGWIDDLPRPRQEQKLPVVLSRSEVKRIFAAVKNVKHQALFMVAYDAGLRVSEIRHLHIRDIDSQRMTIHVRQGKGKRDRYARLTPELLELLRAYWRQYRPDDLLFPGADAQKPYDIATPGQLLKKICRKVGITKRVTMHTLRHALA